MSKDDRWWSMFTAEEMKEIEDKIEKRAYIQAGREEGREEGMQKGIEKGKTNEKIRNVKSMLAENIPKEIIVKVSGFTLEEVDTIESLENKK